MRDEERKEDAKLLNLNKITKKMTKNLKDFAIKMTYYLKKDDVF